MTSNARLDAIGLKNHEHNIKKKHKPSLKNIEKNQLKYFENRAEQNKTYLKLLFLIIGTNV